ncbi:hypothetical protein IMCC26134_12310 [Verrucomicrobia bacterium IMCC26134]|nr:hypothetical protein IMCC26134_12310 [Verrucomicrobia bacterium IMCC26134]
MSSLTKGEKWIKLLRAYGPVADNEAMQAEHVGKLSAHLGIPKLTFNHPARELILNCFPVSTGLFRNVVLTGTAGEGKTSLCFELVQALTGKSAEGHNGVEIITINTEAGQRTITLIYDVTAWRKKTDGHLSPEHVGVLTRMAASAFGTSDEFFVLAVNDGQMHELFRALPNDAPDLLRRLQKTLIGLHARCEKDSGERLRLINLSMVPSEKIMSLCLEAVLDRSDWVCFTEQSDIPLFSESSSLSRNYRALNTPAVRTKLIMLARIADVTGHHLPTRGVLCLLSNALLGHPDARDCVIRPGAEANTIGKSGKAHKAALHRTLFGENLTASNRRKREVYRFLSMLHVGDETTNDLDELLIFGTRDGELKEAHDELVLPDPFSQRNPEFDSLLTRYIRGDINENEEMSLFLAELAAERRRVFLQASQAQLQKYHLWKITVFHHAREYLEEILKPLEEGKSPARLHLRKLASGLNRIWTGLLLAENANEVYLATGLDLTTSPVSDIHLAQLDLDSEPPGLEILRKDAGSVPEAVLRTNGREFRFPLTLPRLEFLCRVADGAMPSSFSRESCADFMSLKQRCLRDLRLKASSRSLHLIEVHGAGTIHRLPIHLAEK